MITDCFDDKTEPVISLRDFYGEQKHLVETCLILFSQKIYQHLLEAFPCEKIGLIGACNGNIPIYRMNYKGTDVAFYLSGIGSAIAASECYEASWIVGASKFVMFGSCGSLNREATRGKFIVPTESYRGEGCSYYFAAPSDYITVENARKLSAIFTELGVPHVTGRVWTTDAMIRDLLGDRLPLQGAAAEIGRGRSAPAVVDEAGEGVAALACLSFRRDVLRIAQGRLTAPAGRTRRRCRDRSCASRPR